ILETIEHSARFEDALAVREREDDAPNYTPRIASMLDLRGEGQLSFAILRANAADSDQTDRIVWRLPFPPQGMGYGITTYRHDGNPLPPFAGDPLWLPLPGSPEDIADAYWNALDEDNRIALAVKVIDAGGSRIILRQD
ncbi:MAG: inosine monophosphate cyclohydrolase, partial [Chloroflexi bacterium]|nr:inosine monophosphate cyclohydrolase [Chloroflexota bacterium]